MSKSLRLKAVHVVICELQPELRMNHIDILFTITIFCLGFVELSMIACSCGGYAGVQLLSSQVK